MIIFSILCSRFLNPTNLYLHLLPYPQDTPKTVQDQQQQEQLKINTGFSYKTHGEVFIYNNSDFYLKFGPFSDKSDFEIYN